MSINKLAPPIWLLRRRAVIMQKDIVNLLDADYCDLPHGLDVNSGQYRFAVYPIIEQLEDGIQVHVKIVLKENYDNKTSIRFYNTGAASASLLGTINIVNGIAEGDLTWKIYSTNSQLRCYALPNNSSLPIPTASHAELYII